MGSTGVIEHFNEGGVVRTIQDGRDESSRSQQHFSEEVSLGKRCLRRLVSRTCGGSK